MSDGTWLGRSYNEWRALWNNADWRAHATRALREIAKCSQADPADRTSALTLWGRAQAEKILPEYYAYPEIVRDTLFDIARGTGRVKMKVRRAMHERLFGVGCLLDTAWKFEASGAGVSSRLPSRADPRAGSAIGLRAGATVCDRIAPC